MKSFSEVVEEVRDLSSDEIRELQRIIKNLLRDARRKEILRNHKRSMTEYKKGKLKFSSDMKVLRDQLK